MEKGSTTGQGCYTTTTKQRENPEEEEEEIQKKNNIFFFFLKKLHGLPEQLCRGPTPPLCSDVITRRSRWNLAGPTKPCRPFDSLIYPLGSFPPAHWKRKTQNNQKMVLPSPQLHLCRESMQRPPQSALMNGTHTHTHTQVPFWFSPSTPIEIRGRSWRRQAVRPGNLVYTHT